MIIRTVWDQNGIMDYHGIGNHCDFHFNSMHFVKMVPCISDVPIIEYNRKLVICQCQPSAWLAQATIDYI